MLKLPRPLRSCATVFPFFVSLYRWSTHKVFNEWLINCQSCSVLHLHLNFCSHPTIIKFPSFSQASRQVVNKSANIAISYCFPQMIKIRRSNIKLGKLKPGQNDQHDCSFIRKTKQLMVRSLFCATFTSASIFWFYCKTSAFAIKFSSDKQDIKNSFCGPT